MFIIFGGLPATGKSTIARQLAYDLNAVYLRIDSIEQAIRSSGILTPDADMGPAGYLAAYRVAADNLRIGRIVIADSVNPLCITRDDYRAVAQKADVAFLEIEVVCSDKTEHRHRVETRRSTVDGLTLPTWEQVESRHYEAWNRDHLVLDTATLSPARCVAIIMERRRNLPR
ncbi:AAA family ATPase [Brenneria uluponensis]|uniref:AAA family ATPase n=1 Tax=Brenneria uluponensis TaxID=3057057 RepID=UPI0028EB05D0|nr:AAA family ATPase [Brenneria ulupoensis]